MPSSLPTVRTAARLTAAALLSALLVVAGVSVVTAPARADTAPANPADPTTPATVSADGLPTVQINGVVWTQVVVGTTVYAGGEFTRARPAGAAPGTQETVRNNLLAYDVRTGALITSFAPDLNAQVKTLAVSPDGATLYVGGDFTQANGQARYRIAAYSTASGQLLPNFQPAFAAEVEALAVTNTSVYVGGANWGSVGGAARNFLAAIDPSTGAVQPWAPVSNDEIGTLTVVNGGKAVVVGGHVTSLDGHAVNGIGEVDATSGAFLPFAASTFTTNGGSASGFTALTTDNDTLYATAYAFGSGNLEGMLAINPQGGAVKWVDDCRGDSYSVYATGTEEYISGHAHDCSNIGGWPQVHPENDALWTYRRAVAFSKAAATTVGSHFPSFTGDPAPALLNWYPQLWPGTYTGMDQAAWSVTGNSQYVVYGGEFTSVNGIAQQGLVRFAVPSIAPNKIGPDGDAMSAPTLQSYASGTVRVGFTATDDPDNSTLRYDVYRSDKPGTPVGSVTASSVFWNLQPLTFTDATAPPGATVNYRITAVDPFGNSATGPSASVTVSTAAVGGTTPDSYSKAILSDSPTHYWRLGESGGTKSYDQAGTSDLTLGSGVTLGRTGALSGLPNTAAAFNGTSSGIASTQTAITGPQVFSAETWFQTTSTGGGTLFNFSQQTTGAASGHDRQIWMDTSGRINFGVWNGEVDSIGSTASYNDGKWHQVVGTLSSAGLALYVDGKLAASNASVTTAQVFTGTWRLGGDTTWDGSGYWFNGTLDEPAVYSVALEAAQVAAHYAAATNPGTNTPPTASFTSSVSGLTASFDASASTDADGSVAAYAWDFGDGTTGTGKTASHAYTKAGTYTVRLTVTDNGGASGSATKSVTITAPANTPPTASFTSSVSGLTVSVDGSASTDADGSVAAYAWDFGDGTTGTGKTASHAYATGGTYTVKLTVTDNGGATAAMAAPVTVSAPAVPGNALASDTYGRTVSGGWGTADTGGPWTVLGDANAASVTGGQGLLTAPAGNLIGAQLPVSVRDVAVQEDLTLASAPTGNGSYVLLTGRSVAGTADGDSAELWFAGDGTVYLGLLSQYNGVQNYLAFAQVPGTYTPGTAMTVRLDVSGTGTTSLKAKAWPAGTTEPTGWTVTGTDTTAGLQTAGGLMTALYQTGSSNSAETLRADNLWAGAAGTVPGGGATPPANTPPTASFTASANALAVSVDGSASADAEGPIASWAWDFGDGSTGTGLTASHTYATAGTYTVKLTVTDSAGATATASRPVTVTAPTNAPPIASFTSSANGLAVSVDGSSSTAASGQVTTWTWDFGDGGTGAGETASHLYAAAGTYTVTLTVLDGKDQSASVSHQVTVATQAATPPLAADAFGRTVASGWGTADTGGAWTVLGDASQVSVSNGAGVLGAAPGNAVATTLQSVSSRDVAVQADFTVSSAATGGGTYAILNGRSIDQNGSGYAAQLWFASDGTVWLVLLSQYNGTQTFLAYQQLPGTYTPGTALTVRLDLSGTGTTTLKAEAWTAGTAEPADWQLTATDSTAGLQVPGAPLVELYQSPTATTPATLRVGHFWMGVSGSKPA